MDYVEAFRNLKTNNKYSRKSPHKAVLLLTIIELYESCVLTENIIKYDDTLKKKFVEVWNKVLPYETTFHSDVYLPFWFMQSEGFWHIVPVRGKEDILELLKVPHVKPSDSKLKDCVNYVELDEDLYFLMTLQSGRSSLKRALLETYTTLSAEKIDELASSVDVFVDNSINAINEYRNVMEPKTHVTDSACVVPGEDLYQKFASLSEDIQIVFNIQYYSLLKEHKWERDLIKEICPTVYDLYDKVKNNPIKQSEISPSFAFTYENFLADLKIALMSEDGAFDIIDDINNAIELLHAEECAKQEYVFDELEVDASSEEHHQDDFADEANIENEELEDELEERQWSDFEIEKMTLYYENGFEIERIAEGLHRNISSVKSQLANLGFIKLPLDFTVHNTTYGGALCDKYGEVVYTDDAKLKIFHNSVYRFNLKSMCLTVKDVKRTDNGWVKGGKMLVAYSDSDLYPRLSRSNFIDEIEDFMEGESREENKIKVNGVWYDYYGDVVSSRPQTSKHEVREQVNTEPSTTSRKRWTAAERKELQMYFESGMSIDKLASFFETTENNVIEVLKKLKVYR